MVKKKKKVIERKEKAEQARGSFPLGSSLVVSQQPRAF